MNLQNPLVLWWYHYIGFVTHEYSQGSCTTYVELWVDQYVVQSLFIDSFYKMDYNVYTEMKNGCILFIPLAEPRLANHLRGAIIYTMVNNLSKICIQ